MQNSLGKSKEWFAFLNASLFYSKACRLRS